MKKKLKILTLTSIILGVFLVTAIAYIAIFSSNAGGNYYNISFNTNSDKTLSDVRIKENEYLSSGYIPQKEGYTFNGWYYDEALTSPYKESKITANTVLYADWRANEYFIIFETNGGTPVTPIPAKHGDVLSILNKTTSKEGHVFAGWYFDKDFKFEFSETTVNKHLTFYAKWYINEVTVKFNTDGGIPTEDIKIYTGGRITLPTTSKEGYDFLGWYKEGNDNQLFTSNFTADKNYTLIAKYERITYSVIFNVNGGEVVQNLNVYESQKVSVLPIGYKEGFHFQGWYIDEALTQIFDINTPITSDITLHAKFEKLNYKVSFDTFGGSDHNAVFVNDGGTYTPNITPTKEGYTFIGWYTDKELTNILTGSVTVDKDITLYAKFERKIFTIKFNTDGAETISNKSLKYLEELVVNPITKAGHTFLGWFTNEAKTTPFVNGTPVTSDLTLYAKFNATKYEVTIISDVTTNLLVEHGKKLNYTSEEKLGYTFKGLYLDTTFNYPFDLNTIITNTYTLYAKYELTIYTITYEAGTYPQVKDVTYGSLISHIQNPIQVGKTFEGWLLNNEPFTLTHMPANNLVLVAKWSENTYAFSFNAMGGTTTPRTQIFIHGKENNMDEPSSTRTGYIFKGWYKDLNDEQSRWDFTQTHIMVSNITLYAKWEANLHTIQYFVNDTNILPINYGYEAEIFEFKPLLEGYTLLGWSEVKEGSNRPLFTMTTMPNRSVNLYPVWEKNTYTISFVNGNLNEISYLYEAEIASLAIPVKQGFTFNNWYMDADLNNVFNLTKMPSRNLVLYASWTVNTNTIGFNSNGGTEVESLTGETGIVVTKPNDPTRVGYTFKGWFTNPQLTTSYEFTTIPSSGIILYAKWEAIMYEINFVPNTSDYIADISIRYNSLIPQLPSLIKEGYIFAGWYLDNDFTTKFNLTHMGANNITLHAKFELAYYRIAFDAEYRIPTIVAAFGENITLPMEPTKAGYTFMGWYTEIELLNQFTYTTMPNNNYYLYAKWQINTYEINFETNEGSVVETISLNYNQTISITTIPERTGYTFAGWYSDENLLTPFTVSNMPANDLTIYAKWIIKKFDVTFIDDSQTVKQFDFNSAINYTPAAKTGHTFLGWFQDDQRLIEAPLYMGTENLVLYAKWQINTYKVTFQSNGGTTFDQLTEEYNKLFTPPTPSKVGYTFDGWYLNSGLTNKFTQTRIPANNITLYAKWNIKSYRLSFSTNGSELADIIYQYNKEIALLPTITKEGYTFKGWFLDQNYTSTYNLTRMPDHDVRVFAKFEINQYEISFESNEGSSVLPIIQNFDSVLREPIKPTKQGYTFKGWFEDNALTEPYNFLRMGASNITLYAKWEVNQYTINFVSTGANLEPLILDYNEVIPTFEAVSQEGYTFIGWFTDNNYQTAFTLTHMPSRNLVLYAKFEINTYTITFESNGGTIINPLSLNFNQQITKPLDPVKEGSKFIGWFEDEALTTSFSFLRMGSTDITLYAKYEVNTYKITFNSNIGTVIQDRIYKYNEFIDTLPTLDVYGNIFLGWYTSNSVKFEVLNNQSYQIKENITLSALWEKGTYTIKFDSNEGSLVDDITLAFNTLVNEPANPTKLNYQFAGWFKDPALTENYYFSRMSGENITLYAKWVRVADIKVTYVNNDGSVDTVMIFNPSEIGVTLTHPTLTQTGYTFNQWYMDQSFTQNSINNLVDYDITLYAKWTINSYTINFDLNGATGTNQLTKNYDEIVIKPNDPIKEGYSFINWYVENTFDTVYVFDKMPANDLTIYAKFEINQYTISFVSNGANELEPITLNFNELIPTFTTVLKEGYTFNGWYTNQALTTKFSATNMISKDLVLYAKFTIKTYKVNYISDLVTIAPLSVKYNAQINLTTPTKEGYTFIGWYLDSNYSEIFNISVMPSINLNAYAKFEINQYTINFDSQGGSEVLAITKDFNSDVIKPTNPTKAGYTFVGWYLADTAYEFTKMGASNITLLAKWNLIPELNFLTASNTYYLLQNDNVFLRVRLTDDDLSFVSLVFTSNNETNLVKLLPNVLNPIETSLSGITASYDSLLSEWIITLDATLIDETFKNSVDLSLTITDQYNHSFEAVLRTYNFEMINAPEVSYVTPSGEVNLGENETFSYEIRVLTTDLIMIKLDTNEFGRINVFMNATDPYGTLANKNRLNALGITLTFTVNEDNIATIKVNFNEEATYRVIVKGELSVVATLEDSIGSTSTITNNYIVK